MARRTFNPGQCPVGRTLERVGDTWSLMILRDAFHGLSRFDQFEQSLGVAPNILSQRLSILVEAGFLERRPYQTRPVRQEYLLTALGRDFVPVLTALLAFGNRHFADEGVASQVVEVDTGLPADPVMVDRRTGREIDDYFTVAAGPAAQAPTLARMTFVEEKRRHRVAQLG